MNVGEGPTGTGMIMCGTGSLETIKVLKDFYASDCKMVGFEGDTSNTLFEILADWNHQLSHCYDKQISDIEDPDDPEPSGSGTSKKRRYAP